MAGSLHLTPGARVIGLTRHNKYGSLHGDRLQPDPSLLAPPKSSSSDEEPDGQQVPHDGGSDDSEFGASMPKKKFNIHEVLRTSSDLNPAKGHNSEKRGLSVEPSNIRASSFTSGTGRNGSQSNQKRNDPDADDDDVPLSFSQSKRPRKSLGYGSTKVNRSLIKTPGSPTKQHRKESDKARRTFKPPGTDSMLAKRKISLRNDLSRVNTADFE